MSAENSPNDPSVTPPAPGTPANAAPAVPPAPGAAPGALAGAQAAQPVALPPENVTRGLLFSLIALPLGVILFVIIWNLGYVASIVGFAIAFAAFFLYKKGSGGRISVRGALLVGAVTLVTLAIAFIIAETMDLASVGFTWAPVSTNPVSESSSAAPKTTPITLPSGRIIGPPELPDRTTARTVYTSRVTSPLS